MISGCTKSSIPRQSSYNSLHKNPLKELRHSRSNSEGGCHYSSNKPIPALFSGEDKGNSVPGKNKQEKPAAFSNNGGDEDKENVALIANAKPALMGCNDKALKPSSLQLCMQMNEPDQRVFGGPGGVWEPSESENSSSLKIWDYSDSEAAPASSWSTLPNKSLLLRPLPLDIGKCTCVIVKEASSEGSHGGTIYSLYTNEGRGRQDRKLAVAKFRRRSGKSEFTVAQTIQGISSNSDDSFLGTINANLMGSKYHIWDQGARLSSAKKQSDKSLIAVVAFAPTITTWTGNYRSMRAFIAKHQSMQLKNTNQVQQHIKGLPKDWEGKKVKVHQLFSRVPQYNKILGQYELDYRDKGRTGLRIRSSVKNFQLTLEESGKQTILQLGRVGKSKYVMDYRYPLTGYQAFCICLASIDSKLCCSV